MLFEGQSAVNFNTQKCDCVFRGDTVIFEADLYSSPDFVKTIALNFSGLTIMELELNQSIAKFDLLVNEWTRDNWDNDDFGTRCMRFMGSILQPITYCILIQLYLAQHFQNHCIRISHLYSQYLLVIRSNCFGCSIF